ncbi:MAG: NAD(+) synthase [Clostridia bacterium]|nr:NAD(+) synthase [Clostridia bacterium]
MRLTLANPGKVCEIIIDFIRQETMDYGLRGAVVGIGGGVDSALVAYLLVEALGPRRVLALYLPERDSPPEGRERAWALAHLLKVNFQIVDLGPGLRALGLYDTMVAKLMKKNLIHSFFAKGLGLMKGANPFLSPRQSQGLAAQATAFQRVKARQRMVLLYYYAEAKNFLLAGTVHRTEYLTGSYVVHGDAACHLAPLLPLYKTQVLQLAEYIGVPQAIRDKPLGQKPVPGLSYEQLDEVLWGWEQGWSRSQIAQEASVSEEQVEKVMQLVDRARLLWRPIAYPVNIGRPLPSAPGKDGIGYG